MRREDFGPDFTWGVASASFQVEGAWDADGKPPSVWDEVGHRGRMLGGPVGDDAIDFYNRYEDDIALTAQLGFGAKRFSLSWPRLMGEGRGPLNPKGVDFYNRVIDSVLEAGLEPWVTVHHWDLPQALHAAGGWADRSIIEPFAEFAAVCAEQFGDRVKRWAIFNEPMSVAGHLLGGLHDRRGFYPRRTLRCVHHMNLAMAQGSRRMRDVLPADAEIGVTHVTMVAHPYEPVDERTRNMKRAVEAIVSDIFVDPAGGLGYPFEASRILNLLKPAIRDGDLEDCVFEYDYLGIQSYGPVPLGQFRLPGLGTLAFPKPSLSDGEVKLKSDIGIPADPDSLLWVLRKYADHPSARRLVITESGFGAQDRLRDGRVRDDVRIWYVREHLRQVLEARKEGIDVDGFFYWSYADNVEWVLGRRPRYGLVYVDYEDDFRRYPKDSAYWFRDFLGGTEGPTILDEFNSAP